MQPPKSALTKKATPPSECQTEIFPECLEDFYNIPSARATNPGNNLAVSQYLGEIATEADLNVRSLPCHACTFANGLDSSSSKISGLT